MIRQRRLLIGVASMSRGSLSPSCRIAFLAFVVALSAAITSQADARASRHHGKQQAKHHHVIHGPSYRPPYAEFVVDANSGETLKELNADEPRHPASLTKIMTLYLLFEQLEAGKFKLDSPLPISSRAALQPPTKLGLKPNQAIAVEDAIKGLCTRSANDAAMVVAEAVGGSEEEFAKLMTEKARALGMTNTTYVNSSGLPAEEQITTARDQAILGRAIQDRFPSYYRYFSTTNFHYRGKDIHNHNALLGNVRGVDGIKTGYTEASGYNLVTSVRREARHLVSVVMGGRSNAARDSRMRELIEQFISLGSVQRTAPAIAPTAIELASQPSTSAPTPAPAPEIAAPAATTPNPAPAASTSAPEIAAPEPTAAPTESAQPTAVSAKPPESHASESPEQARAELHPAKLHTHPAKRSHRSRARGASTDAIPAAATASFSGARPRDAW
jgi:D-alanyl-D-alanine carboxypeptidase